MERRFVVYGHDLLCMMKAIAVVFFTLVFKIDGAMNLKIFRDPKDVNLKNPSKPW